MARHLGGARAGALDVLQAVEEDHHGLVAVQPFQLGDDLRVVIADLLGQRTRHARELLLQAPLEGGRGLQRQLDPQPNAARLALDLDLVHVHVDTPQEPYQAFPIGVGQRPAQRLGASDHLGEGPAVASRRSGTSDGASM